MNDQFLKQACKTSSAVKVVMTVMAIIFASTNVCNDCYGFLKGLTVLPWDAVTLKNQTEIATTALGASIFVMWTLLRLFKSRDIWAIYNFLLYIFFVIIWLYGHMNMINPCIWQTHKCISKVLESFWITKGYSKKNPVYLKTLSK